jgi:hypothetical protein
VRARIAIASITVLAVVLGVGGCLAWRALNAHLPLRLPVEAGCTVNSADSAEKVPLDVEQMANAATIAAVGIRRGVPRRGIVVALATAMQESKLSNLSGGDRDSIGLFQQRPSQDWGTAAQIQDPRYAAGAFYTALLAVPGWQKLRVTEAAQRVQRSGHPEAYEQWAAQSDVLAGAFVGEAAAAVACTVPDTPSERGAAAARRVGDSLRLDWGNVRTAATADQAGLTLTVRDGKTGWQFAHWLVAHAADTGLRRVGFAGRQWTAKTGSWAAAGSPSPSASGPTDDSRVVAEVYSAAG